VLSRVGPCGEGADPAPSALALAFQREGAGVSVRQRMLQIPDMGAGVTLPAVEQRTQTVEEEGKIFDHDPQKERTSVRPRSTWAGRPILAHDEAHRLNRRRTYGKRALALLLVVGVAAALAPGAGAATLRERLDRALNVRGVSRASTGAMAINLDNGNTVYSFHRSLALKPASNEKLPVALAVLEKLGPAHGISTDVLGEGKLDGAIWRGRLLLKGHGDPSLNRADLARLAARLRSLGIRRVTGRILGDESYFDRRRVCRGWKPAWYKVE
jgi:D-Ala-D-Ala carboxypeptidase 3 (S13) family